MRIGVISDTHNFLDPRIPELFSGVGHILHAGDIGMPWILAELALIAPVSAVAGNTDDPSLRYPLTTTVEVADRRFFIRHIIQPYDRDARQEPDFMRARPHVVLFGHTHKRFCETLDGMLYLNPGYAGRPKFGLERSVAILHCDEEDIKVEYIGL